MSTIPSVFERDSRTNIRHLLARYRVHNDVFAISLFVMDLSLFVALVAAAACLPWKLAQLTAGVLAGTVTLRLASIAHDACHNSYTSHRHWNKMIGRLAFLPALQPYTTWEVAHNVIHHSWTSIKDKDYVWIPLSKSEYAQASVCRRFLERVYRSPFGHGLYYFVEMWWRRVVLPSSDWSSVVRPSQRFDIVLVGSSAFLWCALLCYAALFMHRNILWTITCGELVPFLTWCQAFGFTLYVHHAHPKTGFYKDRAAWEFYAAQVSSSTHIEFPWPITRLLHGIFDHTAHHLDVRIPFYRLGEAQAELDSVLDGANVVEPWSFKEFLRCIRLCKLYDYDNHCWTDFSGNPTACVHRRLDE